MFKTGLFVIGMNALEVSYKKEFRYNSNFEALAVKITELFIAPVYL